MSNRAERIKKPPVNLLWQKTIDENTENKRKPIHLGIVLDDPFSSVTVTWRISPLN